MTRILDFEKATHEGIRILRDNELLVPVTLDAPADAIQQALESQARLYADALNRADAREEDK